MTTSTIKSAYLRGLRDGTPFLLVVIPFSMLFGVVATEAGLRLGEVMVMTTLVIAGASQFAALQLMLEGAATPLVIFAALAVNLRMAMYSAALVPFMGAAPLWKRACAAYLLFDQTYAVSALRFEEEERPQSVSDRFAFFFGVATPIAPFWALFTFVGALVGTTIPDWLALDFVLPITFLSLIAPLMKTSAHLAAAIVSVVVGLALIGLPSGLGLLIAAACAMVTGALIETLREARA